jgi:hypothetical protein
MGAPNLMSFKVSCMWVVREEEGGKPKSTSKQMGVFFCTLKAWRR